MVLIWKAVGILLIAACVDFCELARAEDSARTEWPPVRKSLAGEVTWTPGANVGITLEKRHGALFAVIKSHDGESVTNRDPSAFEYFSLLTVFYFSGEKFVGGVQKFSEVGSSLDQTEQRHLPDAPIGSDAAVVVFQIVYMSKRQWPEKTFSEGYTYTYHHFATAVFEKRGLEFRATLQPFDSNFPEWFRSSGFEFRRVARKVVDLPLATKDKR